VDSSLHCNAIIFRQRTFFPRPFFYLTPSLAIWNYTEEVWWRMGDFNYLRTVGKMGNVSLSQQRRTHQCETVPISEKIKHLLNKYQFKRCLWGTWRIFFIDIAIRKRFNKKVNGCILITSAERPNIEFKLVRKKSLKLADSTTSQSYLRLDFLGISWSHKNAAFLFFSSLLQRFLIAMSIGQQDAIASSLGGKEKIIFFSWGRGYTC